MLVVSVGWCVAGEEGVGGGFVVVDVFWFVGEEVDEPVGCLGWFGVEAVFEVFDVVAAVWVLCGWCEDLAAFASDVEAFAESFACVVADFFW